MSWPQGTVSPDHPRWALPLHTLHGPGPHVTPPGPPAPAPVTPQQGRSPAPHSPAQPWTLPNQAHLWAHVPAQPPTFPVPRMVSTAWGWACPSASQLPHSWLGRQDRPWLPGPALTDPAEPTALLAPPLLSREYVRALAPAGR